MNYKIKEGIEFRPYGDASLITSEQLTDELAEYFIKKNPKLLNTVIVKIKTKKDGN